MSEIKVNGVSLFYEEHGSGESILCIHGTGSSAAFWTDAVDELAKHGRAIAYDRRGCSRSERLQPYATNVQEHADDAAALIDALGAAPAIVNGRSYGGAIAIDLALRYPDRVRALALLEAGDVGLPLTEEATGWMTDLEEQVLAAAEADMATVGETLLRGVLGDDVWESIPDSAKQMFTDNAPAIVAEFLGGPLQVSAAELGTLVQPTLLVAAKDSPHALAELTHVLAAAIPAARLALVEGGHAIDPAHPVVLDFIHEVGARKEELSTA